MGRHRKVVRPLDDAPQWRVTLLRWQRDSAGARHADAVLPVRVLDRVTEVGEWIVATLAEFAGHRLVRVEGGYASIADSAYLEHLRVCYEADARARLHVRHGFSGDRGTRFELVVEPLPQPVRRQPRVSAPPVSWADRA